MDDFQGDSMTSRFNWAGPATAGNWSNSGYRVSTGPHGHHPGSTHGKMLEKSSEKVPNSNKKKTYMHSVESLTWQLKIYHFYWYISRRKTRGFSSAHVSEVKPRSRKLHGSPKRAKDMVKHHPRNVEITMKSSYFSGFRWWWIAKKKEKHTLPTVPSLKSNICTNQIRGLP